VTVGIRARSKLVTGLKLMSWVAHDSGQQGMASLGEGERKLLLTLDRLRRLKEERPRICEELEALERNVEEELLQLSWEMKQDEVAYCANKEEEAVIDEDVADMTTMEDELEDDQVKPGSCSLSTWLNEEEPHDDEQGLSVVGKLVGVTCDLVMEDARTRDKGGT